MRDFLLFILLCFLAGPLLAKCVAGNCADGTGRADFPNGDVYVGTWAKGLMHGKGTYTYRSGAVYRGEFAQGQVHGYGVVDYPDGARFEGQWRRNRKHGQGTLIRPSGKTEHGSWANGKRVLENLQTASAQRANSTRPSAASISRPETPAVSLRDCNALYCDEVRGRYTYRDGAVYEGDFEDGQPAGDGQVRYANGDVYEGGWFESAPDGKGTYHFANGRKVSGRWDEGKLIERTYAESSPRPSSALSGHPTRSGSADGVAKMYAVVVGISSYDAMQSLRFTDDDAYQMYAFLKSPEGGALSDDQVEVLVDERATRANIERALAEKLGKADADDIVIFYYSGHGVDGYFVPVDFDGSNNLLSHRRVQQLLEGSAAKHKLVLADACHSGGLLAARSRAASATKLYDAFAQARGGTALLLSSRSTEVSLEANNLRSGVFSHYLLRGMKGAADADKNAVVTVSELHNYLYGRVREYTNRRQTPVLTGDFDAAMPVAILR